MKNLSNVILVDENFRRRASITHGLLADGVHVEPYESAAEITAKWPHGGTVLLHDYAGAVNEIVSHMSQTGKWMPVIAYSETLDARRISKAVWDGASDYLTWPFSSCELLDACATSQKIFKKMTNFYIRETIAKSKVSQLSRREREVLDGIVQGLSNWRIGERLEISPRTVEIHRANLLGKLKARHTSDAIRVAIEANIRS